MQQNVHRALEAAQKIIQMVLTIAVRYGLQRASRAVRDKVTVMAMITVQRDWFAAATIARNLDLASMMVQTVANQVIFTH